MVLQITAVALVSGRHGSIAAESRRTTEDPPTCGVLPEEAAARQLGAGDRAEHRSRRAVRMRASEYGPGGACRSDYATDRGSTGFVLTPVFRATVMMSVAMEMPMQLLGTCRRMPARR